MEQHVHAQEAQRPSLRRQALERAQAHARDCAARSCHGREQVVYYDIGAGALATYPGLANTLLRLSDKLLGGGRGAGFEGNVEDALGFLAFNYLPGDEVFIFGFSRGAATAQAVTRFVDWAGGLPTKSDAYYLPALFRIYVETRGERPSASVLAEINAARAAEQTPRPPLGPFKPIRVVLLGVWDTVIAMGSRAAIPGRAGARSFHIGRQPAQCVAHARQALAIDELRYEFRPEIWERARTGQTLSQRWFADVHSNIGGGYVDDGLANLSFEWIWKDAGQKGLALDDVFLGHYSGYPEDRQYAQTMCSTACGTPCRGVAVADHAGSSDDLRPPTSRSTARPSNACRPAPTNRTPPTRRSCVIRTCAGITGPTTSFAILPASPRSRASSPP